MNSDHNASCPDCELQAPRVTRREFVRRAGSTALAASSLPLFAHVSSANAAPTATSAAESTVARFHQSLTEAQKRVICLPFEHPLRNRVHANWHVTDPLIGDGFYTTQQQALISDIVRGVTTEDGYQRLLKQMDFDNGGIEAYSCAVFGEPGTGRFEWELTGRHLTLRADGDSVANRAFGGPIVYGHGEEDPKENLFHYQTKKANEVFRALDAPQEKIALLRKTPAEAAVPIQGTGGCFPGIRVGDMTSDQRELVEQTLRVILAPYRSEDVDEVMDILESSGGLDELRMAFYHQGDLENDQTWDIWRVEGPSFVWHFRGAPHVHAYINIGIRKSGSA